MTNIGAPAPTPDPGNAGPDAWAVSLSDAELADVLATIDDPDAVVVAVLAGTAYDPDFEIRENADGRA